MSYKWAKSYADKIGFDYYEVSAANGSHTLLPKQDHRNVTVLVLFVDGFIVLCSGTNIKEMFDDIVNLQKLDRNFTNQYQIFRSFCEQFRTGLNPIIGSLRSLTDNLIDDQSQSKHELILEAYQVAIHILEELEEL